MIREPYMSFGRSLMESIRRLASSSAFKKKGSQTMKGYDEIANDDDIWQKFVHTKNDNGIESEEEKKDIYLAVTRKAFHAFAGSEAKLYNEQNTGRATGDDVTLRDKLKCMEPATAKKLEFGEKKE